MTDENGDQGAPEEEPEEEPEERDESVSDPIDDIEGIEDTDDDIEDTDDIDDIEVAPNEKRIGDREDDDDDDDGWYDDEIEQINVMARDHTRHGRPDKALRLRRLLKGPVRPIPADLISGSVRPVVSVYNLADLQAPPRAGKGSGKDEWATFMAAVTDTPLDVARKMDRKDIIELLESRDIIDREEDE